MPRSSTSRASAARASALIQGVATFEAADDDDQNVVAQEQQKKSEADNPSSSIHATTCRYMPSQDAKGTAGMLIVQREVSQDPEFACLTAHEARFVLRAEGHKDTLAGTMAAYVVNKSLTGDAGRPVWLRELLDPHRGKRKDLEAHHGTQSVGEAERCFQMLYDKDGSVRHCDRLNYQVSAEELDTRYGNGEPLLYISLFWMKDRFRGTDLGQQFMRLFLFDIAHDTNGHAFEGEVFLSPAALSEVYDGYCVKQHKAGKTPKTRIAVEDALIASYKKTGYKLVILGDRQRNGEAITIMAKNIGLESTLQELQTSSDAQRAKAFDESTRNINNAPGEKRERKEEDASEDINSTEPVERAAKRRKMGTEEGPQALSDDAATESTERQAKRRKVGTEEEPLVDMSGTLTERHLSEARRQATQPMLYRSSQPPTTLPTSPRRQLQRPQATQSPLYHPCHPPSLPDSPPAPIYHSSQVLTAPDSPPQQRFQVSRTLPPYQGCQVPSAPCGSPYGPLPAPEVQQVKPRAQPQAQHHTPARGHQVATRIPAKVHHVQPQAQPQVQRYAPLGGHQTTIHIPAEVHYVPRLQPQSQRYTPAMGPQAARQLPPQSQLQLRAQAPVQQYTRVRRQDELSDVEGNDTGLSRVYGRRQ